MDTIHIKIDITCVHTTSTYIHSHRAVEKHKRKYTHTCECAHTHFLFYTITQTFMSNKPLYVSVSPCVRIYKSIYFFYTCKFNSYKNIYMHTYALYLCIYVYAYKCTNMYLCMNALMPCVKHTHSCILACEHIST